MISETYERGKSPVVTKGDIVSGLRQMGVEEGDLLQVHSSLSRFGYVEGGAEAVVDALLEAVGQEGTVMVPTFNHGAAEIFDAATTPSGYGAINEALRKRPEARRSVHPTHPYAALGKQAEHLVAGHLHVKTFDGDSPLGKFAQLGGKVLLLGAGMNSNTAAHIGETIYRSPCLGYDQHPRKVRLPGGEVVRAWSDLWRDGPCLVEWEPLETRMRSHNMIVDGKIGGAEIHLMSAADVVNVTIELCQELCPTCPTRPKREVPGEPT